LNTITFGKRRVAPNFGWEDYLSWTRRNRLITKREGSNFCPGLVGPVFKARSFKFLFFFPGRMDTTAFQSKPCEAGGPPMAGPWCGLWAPFTRMMPLSEWRYAGTVAAIFGFVFGSKVSASANFEKVRGELGGQASAGQRGDYGYHALLESPLGETVFAVGRTTVRGGVKWPARSSSAGGSAAGETAWCYL